MRLYGLQTQSDAVNLALRTMTAERASLEEALAMQGTGWDGDLDEMRANRFPPEVIEDALDQWSRRYAGA